MRGDTGRCTHLDDPHVAQVAQCQEVLLLARPINPASAEGECVEVLVDKVEELLGLGQAEGDVAHVKVLHVMRALEVLAHVALAGAPEGLDGKELTLLHACRLAALDDRHRLAGVDLVRPD